MQYVSMGNSQVATMDSEHSTDITSMYKIGAGGEVSRVNPREGISLVFKINKNMIVPSRNSNIDNE